VIKPTFAAAFENRQIFASVKDTLSYKTKSSRKEDVERDWFIIDATNQTVGRMCTQIAHVLRGKHKPSYTPHIDDGDSVIVINAEKVRFTGSKWDDKEYLRYSGYPGGLRRRTAKEQLEKKPISIVEKAVKGMLPKNRLGRQMFKKLHVYGRWRTSTCCTKTKRT